MGRKINRAKKVLIDIVGWFAAGILATVVTIIVPPFYLLKIAINYMWDKIKEWRRTVKSTKDMARDLVKDALRDYKLNVDHSNADSLVAGAAGKTRGEFDQHTQEQLVESLLDLHDGIEKFIKNEVNSVITLRQHTWNGYYTMMSTLRDHACAIHGIRIGTEIIIDGTALCEKDVWAHYSEDRKYTAGAKALAIEFRLPLTNHSSGRVTPATIVARELELRAMKDAGTSQRHLKSLEDHMKNKIGEITHAAKNDGVNTTVSLIELTGIYKGIIAEVMPLYMTAAEIHSKAARKQSAVSGDVPVVALSVPLRSDLEARNDESSATRLQVVQKSALTKPSPKA